jgi:hypothetical protein
MNKHFVKNIENDNIIYEGTEERCNQYCEESNKAIVESGQAACFEVIPAFVVTNATINTQTPIGYIFN